MEIKEVIEKRRSYRAFAPVNITGEMTDELARAASLTASCYNKQPWKFVFVKSKDRLEKIFDALSKGNEWAKKSSLIIAVFTKKDDDCVTGGREYYLFDTGMAVSSMMLRAAGMGLAAHAIAGFSAEKVKEALNIPKEYDVITLLNIGKKTDELSGLSEKQKESEKQRPPRKDREEFMWIDKYKR